MGEQQLDNVLIALVSSTHEAGVAVNVGGVHVDALELQQLLHDVEEAFVGCTHQRGVSVFVWFVHHDIGIF